MDGPVPVSVLLPTVRRTDAIGEVARQLSDADELLVICDAEDDPIAGDRERLPRGARLVVAGEPEGCSGKANAIAAGMEAARHDRIVWTDDDFHHPPEWLATLRADYEAHGPVTELPHFVGRDPLAVLLEPTNVLFGTAGVSLGGKAWAGAAIFDLADLGPDGDAALLDELRRTVSDDGVLSEHLEFTAVRRTRRIPAGGTVRDSLERHARFTQIAFRHAPVGMTCSILASLPIALACVLFPLPAALLLTGVSGAVYASLGIRRWTFLLAYPSSVLGPVLAGYALARRTFVWGGRRYRWHSKYDVEVVGEE